MATTFKTPGVYIQEIDSFPPSINAVETAIPAFIGYTQMAADQNGPLVKIPRKISSMLEYQQFFGFGPKPTVNSVTLDANNNFVSADLDISYKMYESLNLFYANGGGDCYIVSAGLYPTTASVDDFLRDYPASGGNPAVLSPLSAIAKVDEPTLLVFPDNKLLGTEHYKDVYTAALEQCATLQDRFLICDVDYDSTSADEPGSQFRDDIGINNLSYAAAYIPWLNIASPSVIGYADFKDNIYVGSGTSPISSVANLTTDTATYNSVQDLDNLLTDIDTINSATSSLIVSPASTVSGYYSSLKAAVQTASSPGTALANLFTFAYKIANTVNNFVTGTPALHSSVGSSPATSLLSTVKNLISGGNSSATPNFAGLYSSLVPYTNLAADTRTESLASVNLTVSRGTLQTSASVNMTVTPGTPLAAASVSLVVGTGLPQAAAMATLTVNTPSAGDTIGGLSVAIGGTTDQLFDNSVNPYPWGAGSLSTELSNLVTVINGFQTNFVAASTGTAITITDATGAGAGGNSFVLAGTVTSGTMTLTPSAFTGGRNADTISDITVSANGSAVVLQSGPLTQMATDTNAVLASRLNSLLSAGSAPVSISYSGNTITITDNSGGGAAGNAFSVSYTSTFSSGSGIQLGVVSGANFTGGRNADSINTLSVNVGGSTVNMLSSPFVQNSSDISGTAMATRLAALLSGTGLAVTHSTNVITITDASGAGAAGNAFTLSYTLSTSATIGLGVTSGASFAGGKDADSITALTVNVGGSTVSLLSTPFVQTSGDTSDTVMASRLAGALSGTGLTVAYVSGNRIKITAASGTGATGNAYTLSYTENTGATIGLGVTSGTNFTGGVDAIGIGITGYTSPTAPPLGGGTLASDWTVAGNPFMLTTIPTTYYASGSTDAQKAAYIVQVIDTYITQIIQLYSGILPVAQAKEASAEAALTNSFPVLAAIANGVNNAAIPMPPSGAVAGLYAAVDNDRGVWKAPANVSVNDVLGPDSTFNNGQLDELNVDVNAGKSINAIRPFKGKGTLVYGARTLAGNDNNWRYVNVRRFFIMVEQSVKKAIESFVFEPNDANTWNRTKAMVDAFLFQQWRAGALQGSKPNLAYFVKVGLGETMVAQDILEGRMIVSIGMAVVHPAEFIVLQFSQIMPQS